MKISPSRQLEAMRKKMEERLKKLNDQSNKDDILCFEQLGIDMMFIDEADIFKNLFIYSKMTNVSGISLNRFTKSFRLICQNTISQ